MKKLLFTLTTTAALLVATASSALAYGGQGPGTNTDVLPDTVVRAPDELAFTGFDDVAVLLVGAAVLLAVGLAMVLGGRRLSRTAA